MPKRSTEALSKSPHVWLNFPNSIEVVRPTPIEVAAQRTQPCYGRLAPPDRSRPVLVTLLWSAFVLVLDKAVPAESHLHSQDDVVGPLHSQASNLHSAPRWSIAVMP